MAQINITLKNSSKILQAFRKAPQEFAKKLDSAVYRIGVKTNAIVKEDVITRGFMMWKSPIDTGRMRGGIEVKKSSPLRAIIQTSNITPYAVYVHEGTRKMKARPFFDITAKYKAYQIEKMFNEEVEDIVKSIFGKL